VAAAAEREGTRKIRAVAIKVMWWRGLTEVEGRKREAARMD